MTFNIRMTPELHQKIICAANAVNAENNPVNVSEFVRRTARAYVAGKPVSPFAIHERYYKPGSVVLTIKGLPFKIEAGDDFRLYLARRCEMALREERRIHRSYAREAGISSRPPATLEEAMQMACYVEE